MPEKNVVGEEMSRRASLKLGVAGMSAAVALFVLACGGGEEEDEDDDD